MASTSTVPKKTAQALAATAMMIKAALSAIFARNGPNRAIKDAIPYPAVRLILSRLPYAVIALPACTDGADRE